MSKRRSRPAEPDAPAAKPMFDLRERATQTGSDRQFREQIGPHFDSSVGTTLDKLNNFARFTPRQSLSTFLAKDHIFRHILHVHGNVVECGVFYGGGLFTWAQLSAIYEPVNHGRKVVGFDTFSGFPGLTSKDGKAPVDGHKVRGGYRFEAKEELEESTTLFDLNRPVGHIPKIELVKGDATITIPSYVRENPHVVVALLYLDFDLYEPTLAAIETFLPRMPLGSVIAFDELNQRQWPGETLAAMEAVGLGRLRLQRFTFTPSISYAILE